MHPNARLIQRFYERFQERDAESMVACYHKDVVFVDPVFGELKGERARDMWRMLAARATDLHVAASEIEADDVRGSARWIATYPFGAARRRVRNDIRARFEFREGLIVRHEDSFPLWKWARMALGPKGTLLGWTPMVQKRIRREALAGLDKFVASASSSASRPR